MPDPAPILPLAYATPVETHDEPYAGLLSGATACAVLPLSVGAIALVGYLLTRDPGFAVLGLITVLLGSIFLLMGFGFLLRYFWETTRLPPHLRPTFPHWKMRRVPKS